MLVQTPEIHLHGNNTKSDPIYSVHVQPRKSLLKDGKCPIRIVTAGITEIRIWLVTPAEANALGVPQLEFRATLERHEATVNIVRFSPDGLMIASGDVDGVIILWKFSNEIRNPNSIAAADIGFVDKQINQSSADEKLLLLLVLNQIIDKLINIYFCSFYPKMIVVNNRK
jgi:WD40 repeat protein